MPQRDISIGRKILYYLGMMVTVIGMLLFFSTFVTFLLHFGDFTDFNSRVTSEGLRAFGGIFCIVIGQSLRLVGLSGVAGSGLKLNPQEARRDLEPWSRMSGGILKDALDEAGIDVSGQSKEMPFDEQLRRLDTLRQDGLLSEEEYASARSKILEQIGQ